MPAMTIDKAESDQKTDSEVGLNHNKLNKRKFGYFVIKRVFDVVVSCVGVVVLFLPMLLVACCIKLESPGPAIFTQKRMGKDGNEFTIYKFRTMHQSAPSDSATKDIVGVEQYITRIGSFLRRTSIDELPQLYNIIRGDMSIVGYRPVCLTEERLNMLRQEHGVFAIRPGLTGLAQVSGRDNVSLEEKVQLDARYTCECSIKMDIFCLAKTVGIVFTGEGVI